MKLKANSFKWISYTEKATCNQIYEVFFFIIFISRVKNHWTQQFIFLVVALSIFRQYFSSTINIIFINHTEIRIFQFFDFIYLFCGDQFKHIDNKLKRNRYTNAMCVAYVDWKIASSIIFFNMNWYYTWHIHSSYNKISHPFLAAENSQHIG